MTRPAPARSARRQRRRDDPNAAAADPTAADPALAAIGARAGEPVRWRERDGGRWQTGVISHREDDGSLAVVDADGRARSLISERLEVRARGGRGALRWEALPARAAQGEQLRLFA